MQHVPNKDHKFLMFRSICFVHHQCNFFYMKIFLTCSLKSSCTFVYPPMTISTWISPRGLELVLGHSRDLSGLSLLIIKGPRVGYVVLDQKKFEFKLKFVGGDTATVPGLSEKLHVSSTN